METVERFKLLHALQVFQNLIILGTVLHLF
jgi:hypothetical protein